MARKKDKNRLYASVIDAIRDTASNHGILAYKQLTFAIPVDAYGDFERYFKKHGKEDFVEKMICLLAEAK